MKKNILIVLGVVVVIIIGIILAFSHDSVQKNSYYPDSEGWNRKILQEDQFASFFPLTFKENLYLTSPNEEGDFSPKGLNNSSPVFIEYRDNASINMGAQEKEQMFKVLAGRRSFYASKTFTEMPIFKIWTEQVSPEEYPQYQVAIIEQLNGFASSANLEINSYKNNKYYIYLRKDLTPEGLSGKNSIGGAYVFFPEKNTVLSIYLFNTRYNTPDAPLISKEEVDNIIKEIIDSATVK